MPLLAFLETFSFPFQLGNHLGDFCAKLQLWQLEGAALTQNNLALQHTGDSLLFSVEWLRANRNMMSALERDLVLWEQCCTYCTCCICCTSNSMDFSHFTHVENISWVAPQTPCWPVRLLIQLAFVAIFHSLRSLSIGHRPNIFQFSEETPSRGSFLHAVESRCVGKPVPVVLV